jgi:hypothetical protein
MGGKINDKLAIKATVSHKWGTEWAAEDYRHTENRNIIEGYDAKSPDYNGVNIEGEIPWTTSRWFAGLATFDPGFMSLIPLSPNYFDTVMGTGYKLTDMFGSDTFNTKGNFSINYRPDSKTEITVQSLIGTGKAPLSTGGTVYYMNNVTVQQHKIDFKRGGLKARFYYTHEDAGDTQASGGMAVALANAQPGGLRGWFNNYLQNYLGFLATQVKGYPSGMAGLGLVGLDIQNHIVGTAMAGGDTTALRFNDLFGGNTQIAHDYARGVADSFMLDPGTAEFDSAFETISNNTINNLYSGARVQDVSQIFNYEVDYDFEDKLDIGNLIVGANYRQFKLDTGGTLYTDYNGVPIEYNELGAYAQLKTDIFNDKVSMTTSVRYDKQSVLDQGNFTPRLGFLFNLSENQNIRLTAQTGFRNPTNQDKFIGLGQGNYTILGTEKSSVDRFTQTVALTNNQTYTYTGNYVMENAVQKSNFEAADLTYVKPETVSTVELGYRYNSPGLTFDISGYYNAYQNKILGEYVYVPVYTATATTVPAAINAGSFYEFQVDTNLDNNFSAYGASFEAIKTLSPSLTANLIYEYNDIDYTPNNDIEVNMSWNTPEHRVKAGLNYELDKAVNISANGRYNSEYYYESSFFNTDVPENVVFDAKLSVDLKEFNSILEIGGNNIGGENYIAIPGSGLVGTTYYAALKMSL